ncbi:MAG: response regulator [Luteimonas sp.]
MHGMPKQYSWLANQPIRRKLILAFGLVLGLFVLSSYGSFKILGIRSAASQWTLHSYSVVHEALNAELAFREQQVGFRGYLLTSAPSQRLLYDSAGQDLDGKLSRLRLLTSDNPSQQTRLQQLTNAVHDWRVETLADMEQFQSTRAKQTQTDNAGTIAFLNGIEPELNQVHRAFVDVERAERRLLTTRSAALERSVTLSKIFLLTSLLIGVAIGLIAIYYAERLVALPIRQMVALMTRLAEGDHGIKVTRLGRKDEVGAIARALQVFKHSAIETEQHTWVKTAVADISQRLQTAASIPGFADALTAELAPRIQAGVAAFHVPREQDTGLKQAGGYGLQANDPNAPAPVTGRGLVEQCALERKPITLTAIPDDYLHVQSGLGESAPKVITLLPVQTHNVLMGVLEFGSFESPNQAQQALLSDILPVAALSLENLQNALHTTQLLGETQRQAEALRVQQEELRSSNEELHSQALELQRQSDRLRTSEEELRQQSEELQASNEELRQRGDILNEQKRSLEILQRETLDKAGEIARASQYKSDFLANMSHELRTPLNSLLILSRSLADNDDGNLSADEIESAQVIHESGSNLLQLINDILDLSKVEAGKMELVLDDFALDDLTANLSRNFRHMAAEKGLQLDISTNPDLPPTLRNDRTRIGQVLSNLLSNAIKFTSQGSVRVHVSRPDTDTALPEGMQAAHTIAIAVSDTGIGIAADKLDRVFQAFEQADAGTSRQYGGTGLGLTISRSIARLLGGDISLRSEVGAGSTFTLLVRDRIEGDEDSTAALTPSRVSVHTPRIAATPALAIADDRAALQMVGPGKSTLANIPTILIVEDDPAFARILADMIHRKGYRVLAAANGEDGIELARRYQPTGILLDVILPGADGWTVIDTLKADAATRHIPVHFISAVDETARARDLGAVGFLTKPVTRDAIVGAFDRLLHFTAGATRHVLVVDDDSAARLAVRKLIASDSVDITEADSGETALQAMETATFDCVVLDLGLPGMSGFEFLDRIGRLDAAPPVVVYSGRELSREESLQLRQYTDSIVIKGAMSPDRLLDEVSLFLHSMRPQSSASGRDAPQQSASGRGQDNALQGRKVLLVDDDMRNLYALSKVLRSKGLDVVLAQDGPKALAIIDDNPALELVLMDIMMPGMDGLEAMRRIRLQPRHAQLPIIALTAKAMRGDREQCLEAGASDYLTKPIDVDKLLSMMRVWLQG